MKEQQNNKEMSSIWQDRANLSTYEQVHLRMPFVKQVLYVIMHFWMLVILCVCLVWSGEQTQMHQQVFGTLFLANRVFSNIWTLKLLMSANWGANETINMCEVYQLWAKLIN